MEEKIAVINGLRGLLAAPEAGFAKPFGGRPIQALGMTCCSLYLWHVPLRMPMFHALCAPTQHLAVTLPVYVLLVGAIAGLSDRYIEFGRVADWRSLFLIRKRHPAEAPEVTASPPIERPA